jgi:regulator of nucleoside diphosphate kinase
MADGIFITELDRDRLKKLIDDELNNGKGMTSSMRELEREIDKAVVVPPQRLPRHIVSMNTRALLNLNGKDVEVSLVYPRDADWSAWKLSVFSPIGTAILGYGEGEKVTWEIPSGTAEIRIKKIIYQPEAAGDYHL